MKQTILTIVISIIVFALAACGGTSAPAVSVDNSAWTLVSYGGEALLAGSAFTVNFEDGQVRGSAGCNSYGGEYTVNGDSIEIGMLMSTMMACADSAVMDQEQVLLEFLGSVEKLEMSGGQLIFSRADGEALVFAPAE